uniref:Uncharacterized protein n=1 Tax=Zea mays TaxID=4577 RepID=C0P781_MAIZE|nr:unknown [Zea mays]
MGCGHTCFKGMHGKAWQTGRSSAGHRGEQRGGHNWSGRPVRERVPVRAGEGVAAGGVLHGWGVQRRVGDAGARRRGAAGELAVDVQADARQGHAAP